MAEGFDVRPAEGNLWKFCLTEGDASVELLRGSQALIEGDERILFENPNQEIA